METPDKDGNGNGAPAGDEPRSADEVPQEEAPQTVESKPNGDDDEE